MQKMRQVLFRLWASHEHEKAVAAEGWKKGGPMAERAYTEGFRDGYFEAVADLVREGLVVNSVHEEEVRRVAELLN